MSYYSLQASMQWNNYDKGIINNDDSTFKELNVYLQEYKNNTNNSQYYYNLAGYDDKALRECTFSDAIKYLKQIKEAASSIRQQDIINEQQATINQQQQRISTLESSSNAIQTALQSSAFDIQLQSSSNSSNLNVSNTTNNNAISKQVSSIATASNKQQRWAILDSIHGQKLQQNANDLGLVVQQNSSLISNSASTIASQMGENSSTFESEFNSLFTSMNNALGEAYKKYSTSIYFSDTNEFSPIAKNLAETIQGYSDKVNQLKAKYPQAASQIDSMAKNINNNLVAQQKKNWETDKNLLQQEISAMNTSLTNELANAKNDQERSQIQSLFNGEMYWMNLAVNRADEFMGKDITSLFGKTTNASNTTAIGIIVNSPNQSTYDEYKESEWSAFMSPLQIANGQKERQIARNNLMTKLNSVNLEPDKVTKILNEAKHHLQISINRDYIPDNFYDKSKAEVNHSALKAEWNQYEEASKALAESKNAEYAIEELEIYQ